MLQQESIIYNNERFNGFLLLSEKKLRLIFCRSPYRRGRDDVKTKRRANQNAVSTLQMKSNFLFAQRKHRALLSLQLSRVHRLVASPADGGGAYVDQSGHRLE